MKLSDAFYFSTGLAFLAMAKTKNVLSGYKTPKPFGVDDVDRSIAYDHHVVAEWLEELKRYTGDGDYLRGRNVLELGPGSDLGVGTLLLARGARKYNACDVNNLVALTPRSFYDELLARIARSDPAVDTAFLARQVDLQRTGAPSLLNYVVRDDFDLVAAVGAGSVDIVFSQAAFEHFDDIDAVVGQLSRACRSGAVIVAEIDLKTHSRWIRDKDPNNIYRFPNFIYDTFWFRGIPNRVRPYQYYAAFERHGWRDIEMRALAKVPESCSSSAGMASAFRSERNEMEHLSIMFCARLG